MAEAWAGWSRRSTPSDGPLSQKTVTMPLNASTCLSRRFSLKRLSTNSDRLSGDAISVKIDAKSHFTPKSHFSEDHPGSKQANRSLHSCSLLAKRSGTLDSFFSF